MTRSKDTEPDPGPGTNNPAPTTSERRPRFSEELRSLAARFADRPARLSDILEATQGRGFNLLLVCISLPFLTPIPLPGVSAPFGLVVAFIGARLAMGRNPWLPQRWLARELPPRFLATSLGAASWAMRVLEILLKPRLGFLHEVLIFRQVAGLLIMLAGLFLFLPVPLPFANSLPALTIVLLAAGALERDGVSFLAGCLAFTLTVSYFVLLAVGGAHAIERLKQTLFGG